MALLKDLVTTQNEPKAASFPVVMVHYSKLIPSEQNSYSVDKIKELANIILLSGEVKQNLLARKRTPDEYELIAGHRRRLAVKYLVEELGHDEFAMMPVHVERDGDILSEINLILTNSGTRERNDYEKMQEVVRLTELLKEMQNGSEAEKERFRDVFGCDPGLGGREIRKLVAERLGMSETKVANLNHINNNLVPELKEKFRDGKIGVSAANEAAGLPPEEQKGLAEKDEVRIADVKELSVSESDTDELEEYTFEKEVVLEDVAEMQQNQSECCENSSEENEAVAMPQQVLSAYGTPVRVWPEGSLIATPGCEGGHYCDSCSMECRIRQKERQCVEAPCGNPFPCDTLHYGLDSIRNTVGNSCEFINHELAYHRAGDREAAPCCKHCADPCEFICSRAMQALDKVPEQCDAEEQQTETEESELSDIELIRGMLEKENELLDEMIKVDAVEELPKKMLRKEKLLVGALAGMLCDLDMPEPEEPEQPELPLMKNNDQRKAWLRDYKSWGLWYTDEHIGCHYYKYDFDNGARLIAEVYIQHNEFTGADYESSYLHLVGGPEPEPHPTGAYGRWNRHERYNKFPNSETELVEFLKALQPANKKSRLN